MASGASRSRVRPTPSDPEKFCASPAGCLRVLRSRAATAAPPSARLSLWTRVRHLGSAPCAFAPIARLRGAGRDHDFCARSSPIENFQYRQEGLDTGRRKRFDPKLDVIDPFLCVSPQMIGQLFRRAGRRRPPEEKSRPVLRCSLPLRGGENNGKSDRPPQGRRIAARLGTGSVDGLQRRDKISHLIYPNDVPVVGILGTQAKHPLPVRPRCPDQNRHSAAPGRSSHSIAW